MTSQMLLFQRKCFNKGFIHLRTNFTLQTCGCYYRQFSSKLFNFFLKLSRVQMLNLKYFRKEENSTETEELEAREDMVREGEIKMSLQDR